MELHPITAVKEALKLVNMGKSIMVYSNNPDFISAICYICLNKEIETEFFLDGVSYGNQIDPLFEDFNQSMDLLNKLIEEK